MAKKKLSVGNMKNVLIYDDVAYPHAFDTDGRARVQEGPGAADEVARLSDIQGGGIGVALIDAKGDLIVGTADDAVDNLPADPEDWLPLRTDSAQPMGLKWGGHVRMKEGDILKLGFAADVSEGQLEIYNSGNVGYLDIQKHGTQLRIQGEDAFGANRLMMLFDADQVGAVRLDGILTMKEVGTPAAPGVGFGFLIAHTDGKIKYKNSADQLFDLTVGSGILNQVTAVGDLLVGDGPGSLIALPVGADEAALMADSGEAVGMRWVDHLRIGSRMESASVASPTDNPPLKNAIQWGLSTFGQQFLIYHEGQFDNAWIVSRGNTLTISAGPNTGDDPTIVLGKFGEINITPLSGQDLIFYVNNSNRLDVVGPATIRDRLTQESFIQLKSAGPITTPPAGYGFLYNNPINGKAFWRDAGGTDYDLTSGGGAGDVVGPAVAVDEAIARFDGTTGKLIKSSPITLSDAAVISRPSAGQITLSGQIARLGGGANAYFEVLEDTDVLNLKGFGKINLLNSTRVADDIQFSWGLHDDLRIRHEDGGTPINRIQTLAPRDICFETTTGLKMLLMAPGGAVRLYHNDVLCVSTANGGGLHFGNGIPALFGSGNQFQFYHDPSPACNLVKTGLTKLEVHGTGSGTTPLLTIDPTNQRVGINETAPNVELEVKESGGSPGTIRAGRLTRAVGTLILDGQAVQLGSAANQFHWDEASGEVSIRGNSTSLLIPRSDGLDILNQAINLQTINTPAAPVSNNEVRHYFRNGRAVYQFNDAGTVRYISMLLTGTGARSWTTSTTPP